MLMALSVLMSVFIDRKSKLFLVFITLSFLMGLVTSIMMLVELVKPQDEQEAYCEKEDVECRYGFWIGSLIAMVFSTITFILLGVKVN